MSYVQKQCSLVSPESTVIKWSRGLPPPTGWKEMQDDLSGGREVCSVMTPAFPKGRLLSGEGVEEPNVG